MLTRVATALGHEGLPTRNVNEAAGQGRQRHEVVCVTPACLSSALRLNLTASYISVSSPKCSVV